MRKSNLTAKLRLSSTNNTFGLPNTTEATSSSISTATGQGEENVFVTAPPIPTMSKVGKIGEYDSKKETWVNYIERAEFYFLANTIEDAAQKKACILTSVGAETYQLIRNLCAPAKPSEKSYAEINKLVQDHLQPEPNQIAHRYNFNMRNREQSESINEYLAALRQLSEHCKFGTEIDQMLRDRLVCGVNHKKIQQRLLSEGNTLDLQTATDLAIAIEGAEKHSQVIINSRKQESTEQHIL